MSRRTSSFIRSSENEQPSDCYPMHNTDSCHSSDSMDVNLGRTIECIHQIDEDDCSSCSASSADTTRSNSCLSIPLKPFDHCQCEERFSAGVLNDCYWKSVGPLRFKKSLNDEVWKHFELFSWEDVISVYKWGRWPQSVLHILSVLDQMDDIPDSHGECLSSSSFDTVHPVISCRFGPPRDSKKGLELIRNAIQSIFDTDPGPSNNNSPSSGPSPKIIQRRHRTGNYRLEVFFLRYRLLCVERNSLRWYRLSDGNYMLRQDEVGTIAKRLTRAHSDILRDIDAEKVRSRDESFLLSLQIAQDLADEVKRAVIDHPRRLNIYQSLLNTLLAWHNLFGSLAVLGGIVNADHSSNVLDPDIVRELIVKNKVLYGSCEIGGYESFMGSLDHSVPHLMPLSPFQDINDSSAELLHRALGLMKDYRSPQYTSIDDTSNWLHSAGRMEDPPKHHAIDSKVVPEEGILSFRTLSEVYHKFKSSVGRLKTRY